LIKRVEFTGAAAILVKGALALFWEGGKTASPPSTASASSTVDGGDPVFPFYHAHPETLEKSISHKKSVEAIYLMPLADWD
jgi:hypothetical protein